MNGAMAAVLAAGIVGIGLIAVLIILAARGKARAVTAKDERAKPAKAERSGGSGKSGSGTKPSSRSAAPRSGKGKAPAPRKSRTDDGKVPQGRTLKTQDNFLPGGKKTGSAKERPVVVIEDNGKNELAVVPLSSRNGKDRTRLRNYQQGQSYYKHYVEIEDDEGKPIRVNEKFKENHPNMDVSGEDVEKIRDKVFNHSRPAIKNRKKMDKFRKDKKSPRN